MSLSKLPMIQIKNQYDYETRPHDDYLRILGHIKISPHDTGVLRSLGTWDVSELTDFSYMFAGCHIESDITGWDVSACENAEGMFAGCDTFDQDITCWNMAFCKNMWGMFAGCYKFTYDVSMWEDSDEDILTF